MTLPLARHLTPDDNPDHDPDEPRCASDDCDQIARERERERTAECDSR